MLWENETLQQKAVMLGGFICYCTSTDFSLLLFLSFYSFFSMAEFFSLLSSFLSHYFLRWLIFFPSFLPSLNHLWAYVKIYIDNNNNYLHDDLKSIFKCLLFFHLDDETYMEMRRDWALIFILQILKRAQRSWTIWPRSGRQVSVRTVTPTGFPGH